MLRTIAVLVLGGLLAHAAVAQQAPVQQGADSRLWYEAYDDGVREVEQGNYQAGVASLQSAISKRPEQARRVAFYGGRVDAYIPDYYLGVAHLALGNYEEADTAFQRARAAELIAPGDAQYAEFDAQASRASAEVSRQAAQIARGVEPPSQPAPVEPPPVLPPTVPDVETVLPPVARGGDPAIDGRPGGRNLEELLDPDPSPVLPGGSPGREPATSRGGPIVVPPPFIDERAAIAAFFSGEYGDAAASLEALIDSGRDASARAHLYLAFSLAALVVTEGSDEGRMETARLHLANAGTTDALETDRRFLSPRLVALLENQR